MKTIYLFRCLVISIIILVNADCKKVVEPTTTGSVVTPPPPLTPPPLAPGAVAPQVGRGLTTSFIYRVTIVQFPDG
jgi:hypothetical protein